MDAKISVEEKKKEAISRMKAWGIFPETIKQFDRDGLLSESTPPAGACFWVQGEQLQRIREFEEKNNALVYFIIHSYTTIGEMDREDIKSGQQLAYVYNHDMPDCSEFGSIGVELTPATGLRRTW